MATIEQSIEVDVPVSTAYNQWTQFEEFPQFMDGVEQVRPGSRKGCSRRSAPRSARTTAA